VKKVILFELNEVPFRVLDSFCAKHPGSSLATTLPKCFQYETISEDREPLSPWITWPSVHRGVTDRLHQIRSFGQDLQDVDRNHPPLWKILAANSVGTGVCGSLHSYPVPASEKYTFYLPDTFAKTPESFPDFLTPFQEFNLSMARESPRNVSKTVPVRSALRVLAKAGQLGLRRDTFAAIGSQLVDEVFHRWRTTRRRTFQAVLQFDVFMNLLEITRPDFATFFTNHVASAMHRYWAAAFPEDYERNEYGDSWIARYQGEIDFAMGWADRFFRALSRFVETHPEYVLWVATSMGQAAWNAFPVHTQLYLRDINRFMRVMGLGADAWSVRPAMAPLVNLFVSESHLATFEKSLQRLRIDGKPLEFSRAPGGFFSLHFGHVNLHGTPQIAAVGDQEVSFARLGLECVDIEDKAASTGYHIKGGMLLVYDPFHEPREESAMRRQLSTLEIAPAILRNYSVPIPDYMRTDSMLGRY
jgi:hypothetical protein